MTVEIRRGKKFIINSENLLKDTDEFYLSNVAKTSSNTISYHLRNNQLTYGIYHALEKNGFPISKYWIKEDVLNTVGIKEDELYELLEVKKYKKKAYDIANFMNVRKYKPLGGYIEFCDSFNIPYTKYLDDEYYEEFLKDKEKTKVSLVVDVKPEVPNENKPKAYIKDHQSNEKLMERIDEINKRLSGLDYLIHSTIKWHEQDYEKNINGIRTIMGNLDNQSQTLGLEFYLQQYKKEFKEDFETALRVDFIEKTFGIKVSKPTYAEHLLNPKFVYCLFKDNGKFHKK